MSTPSGTTRTTPHELDAVMRASRVISGIVAESVAQTGDAVTMPQLRVLVLVGTRSAVNTSAVAAELDIHPSNASRLCDRLVQAGLLDRRESSTDRRHVVLSLTSAGSELVSSVMDHRREAFRRILDRMQPREREQLRSALDRFAELSGEPPEDAAGW
ncbi:DNA-binding MarR family transcriptional regulator [Microlunatus panaciterrae]|uniref:DNA-binding MarR family transcriptional regulator n=1 Tax=Microlunatus panaciterrae TaxID=400768 RepID=A0ABS2RJD5_9ACTN|nr:DNA-binding MarR family transcriptional regulator [Microlunatus panaciterrae]